jgi:hypothetical protein
MYHWGKSGTEWSALYQTTSHIQQLQQQSKN